MARGEVVGALPAPVPFADEPERRPRLMVDTKCQLARLEFNSMCVFVDACGLEVLREHSLPPRRRGGAAAARRGRFGFIMHDLCSSETIRRAVRRRRPDHVVLRPGRVGARRLRAGGLRAALRLRNCQHPLQRVGDGRYG